MQTGGGIHSRGHAAGFHQSLQQRSRAVHRRGELGVYLISGSDEIYLGGRSIGTIGVAGSFLHQIDFDTSDIEPIPSGVSTFRAKLVDMGSDRNSSNNVVDDVEYHDMPPVPSPPAATGSTTFERGDRVQFETSALQTTSWTT